MSGFAICYGPCVACHRVFAFNPLRVPSLTWQGTRQPVCAACVMRVNPKRVANGLPAIVPLPDAYDAVAEAELPDD
jgi:hypothetical protein